MGLHFGKVPIAVKHGKRFQQTKDLQRALWGIIGVTVSPANSERVWAIVENKEEGGVYRSDDGGETWTKINDERKLRQRAWYYTRIYADTQRRRYYVRFKCSLS